LSGILPRWMVQRSSVKQSPNMRAGENATFEKKTKLKSVSILTLGANFVD
jgi:hypothetical protein